MSSVYGAYAANSWLRFRASHRKLPMVISMKPSALSDENERRLGEICAALSNHARIRILEILAELPESIVADLVKRLPLSQATVSQHLAVLQKAGLVFHEPNGVRRCCWIDLKALSEFAQQVVGWTYDLATSTAKKCSEGETACRT